MAQLHDSIKNNSMVMDKVSGLGKRLSELLSALAEAGKLVAATLQGSSEHKALQAAYGTLEATVKSLRDTYNGLQTRQQTMVREVTAPPAPAPAPVPVAAQTANGGLLHPDFPGLTGYTLANALRKSMPKREKGGWKGVKLPELISLYNASKTPVAPMPLFTRQYTKPVIKTLKEAIPTMDANALLGIIAKQDIDTLRLIVGMLPEKAVHAAMKQQ